jgi:hypothetical protein
MRKQIENITEQEIENLKYIGQWYAGRRFPHQFPSCRTGNHYENPLQKLTSTVRNKPKNAPMSIWSLTEKQKKDK